MKDQVVGDFHATLEVAGRLGPGAPDTANITVITPNNYAGMLLADIATVIRQLDRDSMVDYNFVGVGTNSFPSE